MKRAFAFVWSLWGNAVVLLAAPPTLDHVFPTGIERGASVVVSAAGKFEPWPPQVWIDSPGVVFQPTMVPGKFEVRVEKDAAPGPRLLRIFNEHGASAPKFLIVSREPELLESEPNDDFKAAQKIAALPIVVEGKLGKAGDVDSFAVNLQQGQTLVAWAEAYVLGSPFDGLLRIVDAHGVQCAFNHDGRTLDPLLAWQAPADGTFIVQLFGFAYPPGSDVRLAGSDACIYRLHLTTGPLIAHTLPLALQRGTKATVHLEGWNLPQPTLELDSSALPVGTASVDLPLPALLPSALALSEIPETTETADGAPIAVPGAVSGVIAKPGEEDRFSFHAIKGRAYDLRLSATVFGSSLDGWLRIENADGKELARNDDAQDSHDARLLWTAPADGVFRAALGEVTHRGGAEYFYRLSVTEAQPEVLATAGESALIVAPGKSAELKITIKRSGGFKAKLELVASSLPEGLSLKPVDIPEKDGELTLTLVAEAAAPPASQPLNLILRTEGREFPIRFLLVSTGDNNGVPQGYSELVIGATDVLWLTVPGKPSP